MMLDQTFLVISVLVDVDIVLTSHDETLGCSFSITYA